VLGSLKDGDNSGAAKPQAKPRRKSDSKGAAQGRCHDGSGVGKKPMLSPGRAQDAEGKWPVRRCITGTAKAVAVTKEDVMTAAQAKKKRPLPSRLLRPSPRAAQAASSLGRGGDRVEKACPMTRLARTYRRKLWFECPSPPWPC